VLLHPVRAHVQTLVAWITFRHALTNMHSTSRAVVALVVLAPLYLNKPTPQIRICEQLINEGELRRDVERFGDRGKGGVDEGFSETRRGYYDNTFLSRLIGLNSSGDDFLLIFSQRRTWKVS